MKKSTLRRLMVLALCLTLVTCTLVGGTLAKYTTSVNSTDTARVAYWGWQPETMNIEGLFDKAYTNDNGMNAAADAIAPGTTNSATFAFKYEVNGTILAPEVDYSFTVDTTGSQIDDAIKNNPNILWQLDNGAWGNWDTLMTNIKTLSGNASGTMNYKAGNLPTAFTAADDVHTIAWKWIFDETAANKESGTANNDVNDTTMGNAASLAGVTIKITVTATQLDTTPST